MQVVPDPRISEDNSNRDKSRVLRKKEKERKRKHRLCSIPNILSSFTSGSLSKEFRGPEVNHRHVANKLHRSRLDEDATPLVPARSFQIYGAYVHAVL